MLGSFMMLASGFNVRLPSSVSSSLIRCAGVSFSGKVAMIRPASEMSFSFTDTPAVPTKASTIGSREKVASAGASSTFVHMISRFGIGPSNELFTARTSPTGNSTDGSSARAL